MKRGFFFFLFFFLKDLFIWAVAGAEAEGGRVPAEHRAQYGAQSHDPKVKT